MMTQKKNKLQDYNLEIYLDRTRIVSNVCTDMEGGEIAHKVIDNYAHVVYTKAEDAETNRFLLENYSDNLPHAAKYIFFGLQRLCPDIFGRILYNSIKKKMQYRNIAICGVSPEMMEYSDKAKNNTLIGRLYNLKGVERVDTHTRTPSLGKWHISVNLTHYFTLCTQIDEILKEFFASFPEDIKQTGKYKDFPEPRRLYKLLHLREAKSVSSMTTNQENSLYYSSLINGCSNKLPIEKNITQPPRLTIDMISYCEIVKTGTNKSNTPRTFSISPSKASNKTRSTKTTHTPSIVSSLTTNNVNKMIEKNNEKTSKSFKLLLQDELQKQKSKPMM